MEYGHNKTNRILMIIAGVIFVIMVVLVGAFYMYYTRFVRVSDIVDMSCHELYDWDVSYEGVEERIQPPVSYDISGGQELVIKSKLPTDVTAGWMLDIYNSLDADVYIDGKLRYTYDDYDHDIIGGVVKQFHSYIELDDSDSGSEVMLVARSGYDDSFDMHRVYAGTSFGLLGRIVETDFMYYTLAIALIVIATIAVVIGVILKVAKKSKMPIIAVGVAALFVSLWLIYSSELYQFAFRYYYIGGIMAYMIMLFIGYPIIAYVNEYQKGRYVRFYIVMCLIYEIISIVFFALHFAGRIKLIRNASGLIILEAIILASVIVGLIGDLINRRYREYILSYIGMAVLLVFTVIELVVYAVVSERHVGTAIMTGTYIWIVLALLQQLSSIQAAEEARSNAISESRAKSAFLANMSHEIRTPMNAILGMDEMILREAEDDRVLGYASKIKSAGNMLLSIINDILDLSKIEQGKARLVAAQFKLDAVISDVYNITIGRAGDKGLKYQVNVDSNVPRGFVGDETRLRQIMLNIINNAIKYTSEGEVNVDISCKDISDDTAYRELIIVTSDTGIGIRQEDRAKLFESFERLEVTRNRNIEGTGLGLTITLNYLSMMGGTIDVDSEYGKGSTFTVRIPLEVWDDSPIGDYRDAASKAYDKRDYEPELDIEAARILVVDDNEMNLDVIDGLLEMTGIGIDNATSGPEAIELASNNNYDIIMLDQMMPDMDGTATMKELRRIGIDVPIIVLTADVMDRERYISEGFDDFVGKPVAYKDLEDTLRRHLQSESSGESTASAASAANGK